MQKNKFVQIQDEIPGTHFFTYKNKEYPMNIDFFKSYSNYFSNHQLEFQSKKYIPLLGEDSEISVDLTEDSIQYFINFVHRQQIPLNDENVIYLNYLAKKYEVTSLINVTNDYISSNHDDLVLQLLILYQKDSKFEPQQYEYIVSQNLIKYVDDDRLLSLDISTLFRIVDRYFIENSNSNDENDKVIQFLFKCLKKFGQPASVLFTHVNFANEKAKYLNQLLFDPTVEFDFHFVGCEFLKSFYLRQSEIIKKDEQSRLKMEESERKVGEEVAKIRDEVERRLSEQKSHYEDEIRKLRSEVDQSKSEYERKLSEQKQLFDEEINELRNEVDQSKSEQDRKLSEQKQLFDEEVKKLRSENDKLASQLQELNASKKKNEDDLEKIRNEVSSIKSGQEQKLSELNRKLDEEANKMKKETDGIYKIFTDVKIFRYLSELSGGQNVIDTQIVGYETTKVYDGSIRDLFDNSKDTAFRLSNVEGGYILFDFKTKRVSLSKYYFSVASEKTGRNGGQPKSWRIDGSNDKCSWDPIDVRDNDTSLNGYGFSNTFVCNRVTGKYYRYIRIKEVISHYEHYFLLAELEFYGSIENA